jgi:hypothetical protein
VSLKFAFEIIDKLSTPAKGMSRAVDGVSSSLRKSEADAKAAARAYAEAGKAAQLSTLRDLRTKLAATTDQEKRGKIGLNISKLEAALQRDTSRAVLADRRAMAAATQKERQAAGAAMKSQSASAAEIGATFLGIAGAATAAAMAVGGLSIAFVKYGLAQSETKGNAIKSLELLLKSSDAAKQYYDRLDTIGDVTPFDTSDVIQSAMPLLSAGVSKAGTEKAILGLSDLLSGSQAGAEPGALLQASSVMSQMLATNTYDQEHIKQLMRLSGGYLSIDRLAEAYQGRHTGVSIDKAKGVVSGQHHSIAGAEMAQLVLDVALTKDPKGLFGEVSQKFGKESVSGQLSTLQSNFDRFFQGIDAGPLLKTLDLINNELGKSGEYGPKFQAAFSSIFDAITKPFIEKYTGDGGPERLKRDLDAVLITLKQSADALGVISKDLELISRIFAPLVEFSDSKIGKILTGTNPLLWPSRFEEGTTLIDQGMKGGGSSSTAPMGGLIPSPYSQGGLLSLLPHADGGLVTDIRGGLAKVAPAQGEGLVSIGLGERIMPADAPVGGGIQVHAPIQVDVYVTGGPEELGEQVADAAEKALVGVVRRAVEGVS